MNLDEYQRAALRTAATLGVNAVELIDSGTPEDRMMGEHTLSVLALGLAGEAGEVADTIKKVVGHAHPLQVEALVKELGDQLWYISVMASALGVDLSVVAKQNIEKLRKRYPDGFSTERSINRG